MRLSYQPLTRRWRLVVSPTPIGNSGLALGQTFDTREEAMAAVQRISHWKIAEAGDVDPESRYNVDFRFRLDVSQLPRPFQIGAVGPRRLEHRGHAQPAPDARERRGEHAIAAPRLRRASRCAARAPSAGPSAWPWR